MNKKVPIFECVETIKHEKAVSSLDFLDDTTYVKVLEDGTLSICVVGESEPRSVLKEAFGPIALSVDGKAIFAGSGPSDSTIKIFAVDTTKLLQAKKIEEVGVQLLAVSPNGRILAVGHNQGMLVCDAVTLQILQSFKAKFPVRSAAFLDDVRLAVASNCVHIWNTTTGQVEVEFGSCFPVLAFSRSGNNLATVDDFQVFALWDVASGKERNKPRSHTSVADCLHTFVLMALIGPLGGLVAFVTKPQSVLRYSRDGQLLAVFHGSKDKRIRLRHGTSGEPIEWLSGHGAPVTCMAFSPSGSSLISGSFDQTVRLWRRSGAPL